MEEAAVGWGGGAHGFAHVSMSYHQLMKQIFGIW